MQFNRYRLSLNRLSRLTLILLALATLGQVSIADCLAQQFRLVAPELNAISIANLSESRLEIIDSQGQVNQYHRDADFDSDGGQWLGYRNRQTGKVLLWPSINAGHFQIGSSERGVMRFSQSKMQIQPGDTIDNPLLNQSFPGGPSPNLVLGGRSSWRSFDRSDLFSKIHSLPIHRLPEAQPVYLVSHDADGAGWAFAQRGARLGCISQPNPRAVWWIAPVGQGLVRFQIINDGKIWAVSAEDQQHLRLSLLSNDPRQFWRVCPSFQLRDQFLLESAYFGGTYLTHIGFGGIGLQPLIGLPTQLWAILTPPAPEIAVLQPFWRSVQREIRPNPPIPPAEIELLNSHSSPLIILVGDQRQNQAVQMIRIEANSSTNITVERDAGATLVETVEVLSPLGDWSRQEFVTQIPPSRHIDLSVYEEFLQSIAIDRTGKSPNRIEDVNYAPRSLGLILLSAGSELPDRSQIDIYSQAVAAKNPGAVRRIDPEFMNKQQKDPIQSILERELNSEGESEVEKSDGRRSF